jgi:hypothetical protein
MNALINKIAALAAAANARWGEEGAALWQINEKLTALQEMEAAMRSDKAARASAIHHLQKLEWLRFWVQLGVQIAGSADTPLLAALLLWATSSKEGWGWKITCGLCAYFLSPTAAKLLCAGSGLRGFLRWLCSSLMMPTDPTPATTSYASQQELGVLGGVCYGPRAFISRCRPPPPPMKVKKAASPLSKRKNEYFHVNKLLYLFLSGFGRRL